MSKKLLVFVLCFLTATQIVTAQYSLRVLNPQRGTSSTQGMITSPEITVSPQGAYAQIEMTFTIGTMPNSYYKTTDSLEAVMEFDLPDGSFIHDSWLWLDNQHIIKADVVEKNRAVSIYEGIVQRRRDPSLLVKTGVSSYKLNVYPMKTTYPRTVKIVYFTPVNWQYDKATVELPWQLFASSIVKPDLDLTINYDVDFSSPSLTTGNYSSYKQSGVPGADKLKIPAAAYDSDYIGLKYNISSQDVQLYTYPTSGQEGIYQLIVPSSVYGVHTNTNTVFVIDHPETNYSIYTLEQVKQYLKATLLNNYSDRDSFNIMYESNGVVVKAFSSWEAVTNTAVNTAINSIGKVSNVKGKYEDLITSSLSFCATKSATDAQVVLLSNNRDYSKDQAAVDVMFNKIKNAVGTFKNKVHVVNYSTYNLIVSSASYSANDIWYSKLVLASNGTLNKYNALTRTIENGRYVYKYDLSVPQVLSELAHNSGLSTSSYNVDVDVQNGFTFSEYNLRPVNRINLSKHYVETGKYTGSIANGTAVKVQAIAGGNTVNVNSTVNVIKPGSSELVQGWVHNYISELIGANNGAFTQEIIDSSINNRVLCDLTAFLATDKGDTIATNFNANPNWLTIPVADVKNDTKFKCYPNPFSGALTIEFAKEAEKLEVFDLMGREVFVADVSGSNGVYKWNGRDMSGNDLAKGMYMIVVSSADSKHVIKVMKM